MSETQFSMFPGADLPEIEISEQQADLVTKIEEGQFLDVKSVGIAPAKLSHTISAFANTDGGEIYIGISENILGGYVKQREWSGFPDVEAANGHMQAFEKYFPLGNDFQYEFMRCPTRKGVVLHVTVNRTQGIITATDGKVYIRRGAQNLPQTKSDELRRLEYTKGVISFEGHPTKAPKELITESPVTEEYLSYVVPSALPAAWLKKQSLIVNDQPTVAGILLFAEEPQAQLPKRCGIKVYRYETGETEGYRDVLTFIPITVEGHLYKQIQEAVDKTVTEVEKIKRMGSTGLEAITYPRETLHEIITNAVIHRDYHIADDVHVRIFDNRIEVQSPGRLPAHITPDNILNERFARNGAIVRLLNKFPNPPNRDVGEGLNTAFEKMHQLGLREPSIEERDSDVLVTIRHEPLASPEQTIMNYLETHPTIRNKEAREITHIRDSDKMKRILSTMADKGEIEGVPGAKFGGMKYRKKQK
ncbi:MAG: putative DNA binding domain-containing protein [Alphaproteobacteria bacterium]|nr:putative DNA binding domain-containing protein [Alphaproteobacteria bacterium]